jgi:hypothetical protein
MPALDFPSSPTDGQVYGQYTYDSTKGAWRVSSNSLTSVISSPTAPSSPVAGNIWYNTSDGSMYVYYNDGDTSQWVEMRSEVANSQVGLIPIIPSSVSVASGSATVSPTGLVTITGATNASFIDCFSAAYRDYKVLIHITAAGSNTMHARVRNGSGQVSSNYAGRYLSFAAANGTTITTAFDMVGYTTNDFIDATISQPFMAAPTFSQVNAVQGASTAYLTSCVNSNATSYNSFDLLKGNGEAWSGTVQFYGMR